MYIEAFVQSMAPVIQTTEDQRRVMIMEHRRVVIPADDPEGPLFPFLRDTSLPLTLASLLATWPWLAAAYDHYVKAAGPPPPAPTPAPVPQPRSRPSPRRIVPPPQPIQPPPAVEDDAPHESPPLLGPVFDAAERAYAQALAAPRQDYPAKFDDAEWRNDPKRTERERWRAITVFTPARSEQLRRMDAERAEFIAFTTERRRYLRQERDYLRGKSFVH